MIISCVEFSFWMAKGTWIDCMPSVKTREIFFDFYHNFWIMAIYEHRARQSCQASALPSSTVTWSCPDWIQLCSKFGGRLERLSSSNFWLSSIFSLNFWLWMTKCCRFSSSKLRSDGMLAIDDCCCWWCWWWSCCCACVDNFCWTWLEMRLFSSLEDSSHDSSVDVMSSWNESWANLVCEIIKKSFETEKEKKLVQRSECHRVWKIDWRAQQISLFRLLLSNKTHTFSARPVLNFSCAQNCLFSLLATEILNRLDMVMCLRTAYFCSWIVRRGDFSYILSWKFLFTTSTESDEREQQHKRIFYRRHCKSQAVSAGRRVIFPPRNASTSSDHTKRESHMRREKERERD